MTPVEREIITAKHHHGLTPSEIARQLEIPVRQVVRVTGAMPYARRVTVAVLRQAFGMETFTAGDVAELFGLEHVSAGQALRRMEKVGSAERVGAVKVNSATSVLWRMCDAVTN